MRLIPTLVLSVSVLGAQTKAKVAPMKWMVCVKPVEAYGTHVRFTKEEHLQILLNERNARNTSDWPYRDWENAARSINWFDGPKPVSLSYVKSHMPRAMLLELRFPVDQNPHVVQEGVDLLLAAEKKYDESTKAADASRAYLLELMKKYGIGPTAVFDQDVGGATPQGGCEKYEEQEIKQ